MRRRALSIGIWMLVLAVLGLWIARNLQPSVDLSQFLPHAVTVDDRAFLSQLRSGVGARTLLLSISGDVPVEALADTSRALARRLGKDPRFTMVANGARGDEVMSGLERLFAHRYLIGPRGPCIDDLNDVGLRQALEERLSELRSSLPMLDRDRLAADPVACFRALLLRLLPENGPDRLHGVWFSESLGRALLIAQIADTASDIEVQRAAVSAVRNAFHTLSVQPGVSLELTGPGYFAVASENSIRSETRFLSLAASALIVVVLWLAFRSVDLVIIGALPVVTGILTGIALTILVFDQVHGIALALGITLLGVALDYPSHIFAHACPARTPVVVDRGVWRALFLGMVTTALGYAGLALTHYDGLAQLGLLAATGLAVAALSSRFLLPGLIPPGYGLPRRPWLSEWHSRRPHLGLLAPWFGLALALVLLAATLAGDSSPWDMDLSRLSTIPKTELQRDREIRQALHAPDVSRLLFAVGPDPETVLEAIEEATPALDNLVEQGVIAGYRAANQWIPSAAAQRKRQAALPLDVQLGSDLAAAQEGLSFRLGVFSPFLDDVSASRTLAPLRSEALAGTPHASQLELLLQPLDHQWIGLIPLSRVSETASNSAIATLVENTGLRYLDLRSAGRGLMTAFVSEVQGRLVWMLLAILAVLALGLRDSRRLPRVLAPIAIAVIVDFSLLVLVGDGLTLFHLVSLVLVAGLSIDYALFASRPMANAEAAARTTLSLGVSACSTLAMFGLLAQSSIPALEAIGTTAAIGVLLAFTAAMVLAPVAPTNDHGGKAQKA